MTTITSQRTGNWSDDAANVTSPWYGGGIASGLPTAADAVIIANTHTVTLDTTGCVCLSLTVNSGGTLTCTTAATWDLTMGNATGDTINVVVSTGGTLTLDMSAGAAYTGTVYLNKGVNTTGRGINSTGTTTLKGAAKQSWTRLNGAITAGATSATVDSATGWLIGDKIVFGTTQAYNATPRVDEVTLTSVDTGTGAIGWSGGITYDHADNGYVGNFTRNLVIRPYNTSKSFVRCGSNAPIIQDVLFTALDTAGFGLTGVTLNGTIAGTVLSNNAFYYNTNVAVYLQIIAGLHIRENNVFIAATSNQPTISGQAASVEVGNWESFVIFKNTGGHGASPVNPGEKYSNCVTMATEYAVRSPVGYEGTYQTSSFLANTRVMSTQAAALGNSNYNSCDIGVEFGAYNGTVFVFAGPGGFNLDSCDWQTNGTLYSGQTSLMSAGFVNDMNRNGGVTSHEIRKYNANIIRDNSNFYRSTSDVAIYPTVIATDCQRTLSIPCANGSSIRVVGYVKKSHASNVSATVAITGLGSSVPPFTKAADTNWEQYDLSATNSSGNDGNFTLTYTANSSSGTTNVVYFDGVPDSPFVTKCRHYGFLFNESIPTREVNTYVSAAEATALAYTGITLDDTGKTIVFGSGDADTAQKFYDHVQAWCCDDLTVQVPLVRAGTLYSLTTGWAVLNPYYAGTLTWSGGTVQYTATGTKSDNLDGCIVEFNVAAGGTFTFDGSITGTLDLRNLDDTAITVELPSGSSYTTANNTGGTITVSTPQIYQSVTLTGVTAGSRVQIYDTTNNVELFNGTSTYAWTDGTPAAGDRAIRIHVSYVSGTSAKEFIEANIGTCGATAPSNAVTYLVSQTNDVVYNANAINGSTVAGITFTDAATDLVNIDVASNSVTWPQIYAAFCYWISTASGIADDIAYIQAKDTANYTLTSMQIKNTSSPTEPLVVSGGYGVDASTGQTLTLVDTSGGTLVFAPDHVVSYAVGSGVTAGDKTDIAAAVLNAAATSPIKSDIEKVLGTAVQLGSSSTASIGY